jgi:choline dehydrogenase-like flavoprotein
MIPGAYFPVPYLWLPLMSIPQTALGDKSYGVPCGRVVGGGSVVNAMFFHRSDAELYNAWEELGATGWGWSNLLPYFKKVHDLPRSRVMVLIQTRARPLRHRTQSMRQAITLRGMILYMALMARCKPAMLRMTTRAVVSLCWFRFSD